MIVRYSTKQLATDKSDPGPFKLYVSNLSKSTTEEEIRAMFSAYGTLIDDVVILKVRAPATAERRNAEGRGATMWPPPMSPAVFSFVCLSLLTCLSVVAFAFVCSLLSPFQDQHTLVSKGVAFVRFNTRAEASLAIQSLHEQIRDKDAQHLMQVKFAHSTAEKKLLLSSGGVLPLHRMGMPGSPAAQQQMAGYYPGSHFNPAAGYGQHGQQGYNPYGAPPHMQGGGAGYHHYGGQGPSHNGHSGSNRAPITKGPEGANLFVYGIPESYCDSDLSALFTHFGTVINAKVYRDLSTQKSKGFGFVSFDSVANANQAVQQMNGYMIQGRKINVKPKTEGSNNQHNGGQGMQQHSHMGGQPQHHQPHQQPPHQQPPHLQHQQQQAHPQHAMHAQHHQQQQMAMQHGTHAQAQLQAYYAQLAAQQQAALVQQQQQQQQSNGQVQPSQSPIPASARQANGQPQQQQAQNGYAGGAF